MRHLSRTRITSIEMWQSLSVDWALEYMRLRDAWRQSPVLYAKQRLGFNPTWQQAHLLNAIARPGARVSVRSGHSTGKSAAMSAAIWWKLECFDFSKIVCTAPSSMQFRDILWSELAKWLRDRYEGIHDTAYSEGVCKR